MATPSPDPLDLFLAAAAANGNRPAIIGDHKTWTYDELLVLVRRFARMIHEAGPRPRVVINAGQAAEAYAAMFATLMAGGTYCPLNITHPPARRARVIAMFEPHVVITSLPLDGLGIAESTRVIRTDAVLGEPLHDPIADRDPLAYVMFTSGSTGEPKGVMIGRDGLGHYTRWAIDAMALVPEDRWSQHPNIGFDLSVLDIYGALCSGAALVPITSTKARLTPGLVIREHALTIWNSVPSVMDLMIRTKHITAENFASLRMITFCGEPLLKEHVEAIFAARPDVTVHNTYGPTEATVSCTLVKLTPENFRERCRPSVSLGVGIPGMDVRLDGDDVDGAEGEIVISGPQVAFGYWRAPEQTSAAFVLSGERTYRTGDWGQRHGGELYFLSRTDRQVKRHGYRIELGDIDAVARQIADRASCTVYVKQRLITFLEGGDVAANEIMSKLGAKLPPYMLPDEIRSISKLPRNANDKIDAKELQRIAAE